MLVAGQYTQSRLACKERNLQVHLNTLTLRLPKATDYPREFKTENRAFLCNRRISRPRTHRAGDLRLIAGALDMPWNIRNQLGL